MMRFHFKGLRNVCVASLILLPLAIAPAVSAEEQPSNLDQLLEQVQKSAEQTDQINREREREFRRARGKQESLVRAAKKEYKETEDLARKLRKELDEAEAELKKLQDELDEQSGDLRELFSVARSFAGDLQAAVDLSLTSLDNPDRAASLAAIANQSGVIGNEGLRQLWFLMQQEATELGKVKRLSQPVVAPDGNASKQTVVRVGGFSVLSEEGYLRYNEGRLELLGKQPSSGAVSDAEALTQARDGFHPVLVDPTRGAILGLLVESPTLIERVKQGGLVGYVILALGAFGLLLAAVRLVILTIRGKAIHSQAKQASSPDSGNALGRILSVFTAADAEDTETLELKLDDAILREVPALERGQTTLKLLAAVAPLLGLLGTVTGMIITFQSITLFGTGDPKLMAGGISQALVTTVLGLVVAIPLLFAHAFLASRSRALIQILEQQSAGLLARVVEAKSSSST